MLSHFELELERIRGGMDRRMVCHAVASVEVARELCAVAVASGDEATVASLSDFADASSVATVGGWVDRLARAGFGPEDTVRETYRVCGWHLLTKVTFVGVRSADGYVESDWDGSTVAVFTDGVEQFEPTADVRWSNPRPLGWFDPLDADGFCLLLEDGLAAA